jgi:hypothetical protein
MFYDLKDQFVTKRNLKDQFVTKKSERTNLL